MTAQVLRGSKQEIADKVSQMPGDIREVVVFVAGPSDSPGPANDPNSDFQQRFARLVTEWKHGRGQSSKLKDLAMHPAYQQIIGMGEPAVPLLIEEMKQRPDQWDWALRAITGVDPVPRESWGKLTEIAAAWIAWEKERGRIN
jgi:hypothetical protein